MALALGAIASPLELKARWAYSELTSTRIAARYGSQQLLSLNTLAQSGADFDAVDVSQWRLLADALHVTRGPLANWADQHQAFVLQEWSKGRLCQSQTLNYFDRGVNRWQPYLDFLHGPHLTLPDGSPDHDDPRVLADRIPAGQREAPQWGAIAIQEFPNILVDGYLRSILFMRDADRTATLPVWVGLGGSPWRVALEQTGRRLRGSELLPG